MSQTPERNPEALWPGDTGKLPEATRRVLVRLIKGPSLTRANERELWETLLVSEDAVRSYLNDLFLDLVVDRDNEVAFVRQPTFERAPEVVRTHNLTFMDTLLLLLLRDLLLREDGPVVVGKDELLDAVAPYRQPGRDQTDYARRVNASWDKLVRANLLKRTEEGRAQVSDLVRYLIDADRVDALREAFEATIPPEERPDEGPDGGGLPE